MNCHGIGNKQGHRLRGFPCGVVRKGNPRRPLNLVSEQRTRRVYIAIKGMGQSFACRAQRHRAKAGRPDAMPEEKSQWVRASDPKKRLLRDELLGRMHLAPVDSKKSGTYVQRWPECFSEKQWPPLICTASVVCGHRL